MSSEYRLEVRYYYSKYLSNKPAREVLSETHFTNKETMETKIKGLYQHWTAGVSRTQVVNARAKILTFHCRIQTSTQEHNIGTCIFMCVLIGKKNGDVITVWVAIVSTEWYKMYLWFILKFTILMKSLKIKVSAWTNILFKYLVLSQREKNLLWGKLSN